MSKGLEYLKSPEKRALDVFGSVSLAVPSIGVSGLAVIAMRGEIGCFKDAFFRQVRPGLNGEEFIVNKLRTINRKLTDGTELKIYGDLDPRAGSIGKLIRRLSVDELPQLINVARGDMSLVGPRPLQRAIIKKYAHADPDVFPDWYRFYSSVRPGITGPSQIMRKQEKDATTNEVRSRSMIMDLEYGANASLALDLSLLAETPLDLAWAAEHDFERAHSPVRPASAFENEI